jgi:hypothetical protein
VLGVCGLVLVTGAVITWLADHSARGNTEALIDSLFREVSGHAVTHTRAFVFRAAPLVESMRNLGDKGLALDDSDRLAAQLLAFLKGNPGLSWVSYGVTSQEVGRFSGPAHSHAESVPVRPPENPGEGCEPKAPERMSRGEFSGDPVRPCFRGARP